MSLRILTHPLQGFQLLMDSRVILVVLSIVLIGIVLLKVGDKIFEYF